MDTHHNYLTPQLIAELVSLVGKENISIEPGVLEGYTSDEMPHPKGCLPEVIVKPEETATVSRLLKFASEKRIPVTPRGAGTGLSGGCIPVQGGIVLSLERMNRILEIDEANFVAVVEPGVPLNDIKTQVESRGLFYPLYPGEMTATIGSNVATNAGGMNAVKYGVTRHHILGLEAVLPNGEVIRTGGKFVKSCTGYDLTQILIGSEGTLAVVTKIIIKLAAKPANREVLFIPFNDLQNAINAVPEILRLGTVPVGIEFMEKGIIEIVENYLEKELPYHDYEAFLMVIAEANSENEILDYFSQVSEIGKKHGAIEAMVPNSERAKRRLLDAREKFYHALKKHAPMELIDVVVPRSDIARFVKQVKDIAGRHNVQVIAYGHAGDGNVHLHPICRDLNEEEWWCRLPPLMEEIYRAGISYGGAISGEHGIGISKKPYVPIQLDAAYINVLRSIKKAFDPGNILNPGKIFDQDV